MTTPRHSDSPPLWSEPREPNSPPQPRPSTKSSAPKSSAPGWTIINFGLDATLLLGFIVLAWSSTIIRFVFPPAANARGWTLWGWDLDRWIGFQFATLSLFALLVLLHVMLHWTWVCGVVSWRFLRDGQGKKRTFDDGERTLIGVAFLILVLAILGTAMVGAMFMVRSPI